MSTAALEAVGLRGLMARTRGRPEVAIGLIDGPVADVPALRNALIRRSGAGPDSCRRPDSPPCRHGTFVAGIFSAAPDSGAPGICPGCTLIVHPIFLREAPADRGGSLTAAIDDLAEALVSTVEAGARLVNLSIAVARPSSSQERRLEEALDHVAARGALVVAAAGNQGQVGSSALTRHGSVVPVMGSDLRGRPTAESNLSHTIGRRGIAAPGEHIESLAPDGGRVVASGTSVAVPFVTGALALLWSEFPGASAAELRFAIGGGGWQPRGRLVAPLLDARSAYRMLAAVTGGDHRRERATPAGGRP